MVMWLRVFSCVGVALSRGSIAAPVSVTVNFWLIQSADPTLWPEAIRQTQVERHAKSHVPRSDRDLTRVSYPGFVPIATIEQ